jgi:hypothetical protein
MTSQAIVKNGYSVSKNNYLSLILALLKSDDLISAIETLQEVEARDVVLGSEETRTLKDALVENLTTGPGTMEDQKMRLENLYLALVDQKYKGDQVVPVIVLYALIEATAKLRQMTLCRNIFDDLTTVFQLAPSVDAYNSLLFAVSLGEKVTTGKLLVIVEDMAKFTPTGPNSTTYAILVEVLIDLENTSILKKVLHVMAEQSIALPGRATRRLFHFLKTRQHVFDDVTYLQFLEDVAWPYRLS